MQWQNQTWEYFLLRPELFKDLFRFELLGISNSLYSSYGQLSPHVILCGCASGHLSLLV